MFQYRLEHGVAGNHLAIPLGRKLGCTLERFEVDVMNAEALAVTVGPLEVVKQAPKEIALDGIVFGGGSMKVGDVAAEIHHAVSVFNTAFGGDNIVG